MILGRVCATDKSLKDKLMLLMERNTIRSNTTVDFGVGEDVTGMLYVLRTCCNNSLFFSISCTSVAVCMYMN